MFVLTSKANAAYVTSIHYSTRDRAETTLGGVKCFFLKEKERFL